MAPNKPMAKKAKKSSSKKKGVDGRIMRVMNVPPPLARLSLPSSTQDGRNFTNCVLGLTPGEPQRIPDGSACKTLALSMKLSLSIIPDANGNIFGWVCPGLPASLFIGAGEFSCTPIGGTAYNTYSLVSGATVIPVGVPFVEECSLAPGNGTTTQYLNGRGMVQARFVGGMLKLTPTGPPLTRQGQIAIADVAVQRNHPTPQAISDAAVGTIAGTSTNYIEDLCLARYTSIGDGDVTTFMSYANISSYPKATTCEYGEVTCNAPIKPGSAYGQWKMVSPVFQSSGAVNTLLDHQPEMEIFDFSVSGSTCGGATVGAANVNFDIANSAVGQASGGHNYRAIYGNYWREEGSSFKVFSATGLAATQPLMLDVDMCFEACVDVNSSYRGFVDQVPKLDTKALKAATDMLASLPASVPAPPSKPWYTTLAEVASAIGKSVSGMGIPWVSPIGGVVSTLAGLAI
jgi:hypothetical protein